MLTPEELEAILERIRTGCATEVDLEALRRSLKLDGEVVQIDSPQGRCCINIGTVSGGEVSVGDRTYYGADAKTIEAALRSVLDEQQKILEQQKAKRPRLERDFLGMVQAEVSDSLKQSLHQAVLMNLGKEEQPEQVERLWDTKIKVADQPNILLPNDTKTIEVFDREDIAGRLLILGNPGSGKTTTLLDLAKALIERAETEPDFPIPVLFNLSSWNDDKQPLHKWMVQELKLRGVHSNTTRKWLGNCKLLPLLDGLDEMAADRQETCVEALNQQLLTGEKSLPYLVVCSRNEEYDNYETKLLLNGAISIQSLTIDKIQSYLNSIDQSELCHTLERDPELLALVRTPIFLSIAALSFQELPYERWQTFTTAEGRIEYLLDAYIQQMMERKLDRSTLKNRNRSGGVRI
jgi:predicted NACHT family NTPase